MILIRLDTLFESVPGFCLVTKYLFYLKPKSVSIRLDFIQQPTHYMGCQLLDALFGSLNKQYLVPREC